MCQDDDCLDLPFEYGEYVTAITLSVNDDLSGSITQVVTYGEVVETDSENVSVVNEGENNYKIAVGDDSDSLNCTLDRSELNCSYTDASWEFKKQ